MTMRGVVLVGVVVDVVHPNTTNYESTYNDRPTDGRKNERDNFISSASNCLLSHKSVNSTLIVS